jgi:8-oxo-dGTP pyrophosphatase MutT (NUDIX family)
MKDIIKRILRETFDEVIKCFNCGWSWKKSESDKKDLYLCHKCGYDNSSEYKNNNDRDHSSAGVLIKCLNTDRVFLMLRNDIIPTWSLVSGHIDDGETPLECLNREVVEELSIDPSQITFKKVKEYVSKNKVFHYYVGFTYDEFKPKLNNENLKCGWFSKNNIPHPLYDKMEEKLKQIWQISR